MRLRVIVFALVATAVAVALVLPSAGAKPPKPPKPPQANDHYGRSHDYFKLDDHYGRS